MEHTIAPRYNRKGDEARRLNIAPRTLEKWVASKIVPVRRIGRILLFDPAETDHALATRFRIAAIGERELKKAGAR